MSATGLAKHRDGVETLAPGAARVIRHVKQLEKGAPSAQTGEAADQGAKEVARARQSQLVNDLTTRP
jgi:hypothetical protein